MENFKWLHLLYAVILISSAQVIVWFQHNWQFINPKMKPEWWGWYVIAIPITWMFLKGTYYGVTAFDGDLWPQRLIGFSTGMFAFAILTYIHLNQAITLKTAVTLALATAIVVIQIVWK